MSRDLITKWFSRLPSGEQDLPLLILNGIAYTPRTTLNEVLRGSALGNQLQALVETGRFGTTSLEEQQIAKIRLQQILGSKPDKPLFATLSGKVFTPRELLSQIQSGTAIGNQWIQNEISQMRMLVSIR